MEFEWHLVLTLCGHYKILCYIVSAPYPVFQSYGYVLR